MLIAMHIWLVIICGSICCLTMCNFLHFLTSFPLSSFLQFLAHYSFSRFLISSFPHFLDSMHFLISCISHPAFRPTLVYQARPSLNLQKSERRSSIRYQYSQFTACHGCRQIYSFGVLTFITHHKQLCTVHFVHSHLGGSGGMLLKKFFFLNKPSENDSKKLQL